MVTASLNNYRQSPRKVRLVADLIRGKSVNHALTTLDHLPKRATEALSGLLNSAVANAKNNFSLDQDNLYIKEIQVNVGVTMKRRMPRARGSAFPINKRTSHVSLTLAERAEAPKKKAKAKKTK
jgi:large subunit ribosomal protein L22